MTEQPLIKIGDAARLAGMSVRTVNRWRNEGVIVAAKYCGEGKNGGGWYTPREIEIMCAVRQLLQLGLTATVASIYAKRWREHSDIEINVSDLLGLTITSDGSVFPREQTGAQHDELLATG